MQRIAQLVSCPFHFFPSPAFPLPAIGPFSRSLFYARSLYLAEEKEGKRGRKVSYLSGSRRLLSLRSRASTHSRSFLADSRARMERNKRTTTRRRPWVQLHGEKEFLPVVLIRVNARASVSFHPRSAPCRAPFSRFFSSGPNPSAIRRVPTVPMRRA